jgi:2,4-diaminopentanoate dehydrogenase
MSGKRAIKDRPLRTIVWAPGTIGAACIREVIKQPEFELVGVFAYSKEKGGKDAGDLVGMPKTGVKVTLDKEEIYKLDADCVLHCAMVEADTTTMDNDITRLLESGKNVISAAAYHFPPLKGKEYKEKLENACKRGNASLHGSGIHPGFFIERLGLTLTGLCNRIEHFSCKEINEMSRINNPLIMTNMGFGSDPDAFEPGKPAYLVTERYYKEPMLLAGFVLFGERLEHIDFKTEVTVAEQDLKNDWGTVKKGKIAGLKHVFTGYLGGKPRLTIEENWYQGQNNRPYPTVTDNDYYIIDIEGEPCSVHMEMAYKASFAKGLGRYPGDPTEPPFYATAVTMMQATPLVCAAPPGIVYPKVWAHYAKDIRTLADELPIGASFA